MNKFKVYFLIFVGFLLGLSLSFVFLTKTVKGDNSNIISACSNPSGLLRLLKPGDICKQNETALSWNSSTGLLQNNPPLVCPGCDLSNNGYTPGSNYLIQTLTGVNLNNSFLRNADLRAVNFSNSTLINANLVNTKLAGANFTGANLTNANLYFSDFTQPNNSNLPTNFTNTNLTGVMGLDSANNINDVAAFIWSNTTCPDGTNSNVNSYCQGHLTP